MSRVRDNIIINAPYDYIRSHKLYNKHLGYMGKLHRSCCQIICSNGYRCQNFVCQSIDTSKIKCDIKHYTQITQISQAPTQSEIKTPEILNVCQKHWNKIKTNANAMFKWIKWSATGLCVAAINTHLGINWNRLTFNISNIPCSNNNISDKMQEPLIFKRSLITMITLKQSISIIKRDMSSLYTAMIRKPVNKNQQKIARSRRYYVQNPTQLKQKQMNVLQKLVI